jgi:hypothetical protein
MMSWRRTMECGGEDRGGVRKEICESYKKLGGRE